MVWCGAGKEDGGGGRTRQPVVNIIRYVSYEYVRASRYVFCFRQAGLIGLDRAWVAPSFIILCR